MEDPEEIVRDKVKDLFNERIRRHGNLNAVLDASPGKRAEHQNILRDYITRTALFRFLKPEPEDSVLDFGCGMGRISRYLAPKVRRITGIDLSEEMIRHAVEHSGELNNLDFLVLTGSGWPFPADTFDRIYTVWVLQHVSNSEVQNLGYSFFNSLKPNGSLVILEQIAATERAFNQIHIQRTVNAYTSLLIPAGFTLLNAEPVFRMPSYAMWLWNKFPLLARLGPAPFALLERLTLKRKTEEADYFTYAMVFRKTSPTSI